MPGNLVKEHLGLFRRFEHSVESYIEELINDQAVFKFPLLLAVVLRECRAGTPDDVFAVALQLRNDPLIEQLRQLLDQYVAAYSALDLKALARIDRIIRNELAGTKSRLSGELPAEFKLSIKPGLFPLSVGWEVKSVLQNYRDRKERVPLANLARMTKHALDIFGEMRTKICSVLPLDLPPRPSC